MLSKIMHWARHGILRKYMLFRFRKKHFKLNLIEDASRYAEGARRHYPYSSRLFKNDIAISYFTVIPLLDLIRKGYPDDVLKAYVKSMDFTSDDFFWIIKSAGLYGLNKEGEIYSPEHYMKAALITLSSLEISQEDMLRSSFKLNMYGSKTFYFLISVFIETDNQQFWPISLFNAEPYLWSGFFCRYWEIYSRVITDAKKFRPDSLCLKSDCLTSHLFIRKITSIRDPLKVGPNEAYPVPGQPCPVLSSLIKGYPLEDEGDMIDQFYTPISFVIQRDNISFSPDLCSDVVKQIADQDLERITYAHALSLRILLESAITPENKIALATILLASCEQLFAALKVIETNLFPEEGKDTAAQIENKMVCLLFHFGNKSRVESLAAKLDYQLQKRFLDHGMEPKKLPKLTRHDMLGQLHKDMAL